MSNTLLSFDEYLKRQYTDKGTDHTHTRIGDKSTKIKGGSYNIKNEEDFLEVYYNHVFVNRCKEYLTEKQFIEDAPVVVDIDMRYLPNISKRQHTKDHIVDLIDIYGRNISRISNLVDGQKIEVFVMEKSTVNMLDNKTKDGIHIIFGISMHKAAQVLIREEVVSELKEVWSDLPLENDMDDVVDEGVTRGLVNWQLYGSCKPNHSAYLIKYNFELLWNADKEIWSIAEVDIDKFNTKENLHKLSVRCKVFPKAKFKDHYSESINKLKEGLNRKKKSIKLVVKKSESEVNSINSMEKLDAFVTDMIESIERSPLDYELKETHEFTMILPKQYWGPGSRNKWIRVGWALKNTNTRLLATWLKFSSQSKEFSFGDIPQLVSQWYKFDYDNPDGLTARSIMYWAKLDNPGAYTGVREATISYYMDLSVTHATDWDLAQVLYQICKDQFVCVSIKKDIWYEYRKHRWYEIDSGNTLRGIISKGMHEMYQKKVVEMLEALNKMDQTDVQGEKIRKRSNKMADLCLLLKKTPSKNNIMREAKELFYDKDFINKMDQNSNLLCFNNCVVDFKNKIHRAGHPDDYISKSTNIDYIPIEEARKQVKTRQEIEEFMQQLFPNEELRKYMWEHLASTLIGNNDNQTFNIYTGSGRNGKSKLVDLMSKLLGDYKATVPITLVTQKKPQIGSTSSEIVQLMGVRYAVMQEPSKGEKINEGIMKEITGGDPIQGRALFKEAVTFIPQFKLAVCTNTLFDIKSNDDGTWRRIRVCDFMSKFLEKPYSDEDKFPKSDYPYQYEIDKRIDEKFPRWVPILASMLVDLTYKQQGGVTDCKIVMASSDQYREGQDYLTEFCKEKIRHVPNGRIKKSEIWEVFKQWYTINYGKGLPKARELNEFMDKKYGKYITKSRWVNIAINYEDDDDDDDD
jgi:P4 family phage/plasmid primase-like protien